MSSTRNGTSTTLEVHLHARRRWFAPALSATLSAVCVAILVVALVGPHASASAGFVFGIVAALVAAVLFAFPAAFAWLGVETLSVGEGGLTHEWRIGPIRRSTRADTASVESICVGTRRHGSLFLLVPMNWVEIRVRSQPQPIRVGAWIPLRRPAAEALAERLRHRLLAT